MAIQINDRDLLIFKLIDEHQVLLEKHIAWFIAGEDKPVLIRDRLRKLFYLDYLLCQRHNSKLPWWTTPTKPLVYMLSPMSRSISEAASETIDLFDNEVQRHFLEVANIRMVCLVAKQAGDVQELEWTTCKADPQTPQVLDAIVALTNNGEVRKIGIMNHPGDQKILRGNLEACLKNNGIDVIGIVSRDESHQEVMKKAIAQFGDGFDFSKILLVTHHNLYKFGITKACWNNVSCQKTNLIEGSPNGLGEAVILKQPMPQPRAATA